MKRILASLVLMVLLFPALALGETMDDLVKRDGLFYKKFTVVPFTGKITGTTQGAVRNGKEEGPWVYYHDNGQLDDKGTSTTVSTTVLGLVTRLMVVKSLRTKNKTPGFD